jgi:hypothetical protein
MYSDHNANMKYTSESQSQNSVDPKIHKYPTYDSVMRKLSYM